MGWVMVSLLWVQTKNGTQIIQTQGKIKNKKTKRKADARSSEK
jgi:hypothetical protein